MNLARTTARGAGITLAAQGVRFALQIVSLTVMARLLTPAQFGVVAMVTAVTGVAEIVRDFGLSSAAIQAKTLSTAERDNLLWANTAIGAGCTVLMAAAAPLLAWLYGDQRVVGITLALAWLFLVSGFNTQYRADLSRHLRFGALAFTDTFAQACAITVGIVAAGLGAGYWSIVALQITLSVVTLLTNLWNCRWLPKLPRRDVSIRKFFAYGANVLSTQVLGYAINNVDNIAIGARWGATALGLYSRGYQLVQVPLSQVSAPMSRVALPVLSRLQDDAPRLQRYVDRFQLLSCYVLAFSFSVVAGLCVPIVAVLFGENWAAVAPIVAILAIAGIFKCFGQVPYLVFLAVGKTGTMAKFYLWSRPIMILVILAGLPWGPVGVAVGQLVAAFGSWFASLTLLARHTTVEVKLQFLQSVRTLVFACAPAALIGYYLTHVLSSWPAILQLLCGGLASLAWLALVCAVVPVMRRDFLQVLEAVKAARSGKD